MKKKKNYNLNQFDSILLYVNDRIISQIMSHRRNETIICKL